jgi:hypothetical protein
VAVDISLSLQSLIEEENVSHSNPLQLASHLGDLLTVSHMSADTDRAGRERRV